jgi:hypothetical protein
MDEKLVWLHIVSKTIPYSNISKCTGTTPTYHFRQYSQSKKQENEVNGRLVAMIGDQWIDKLALLQQ